MNCKFSILLLFLILCIGCTSNLKRNCKHPDNLFHVYIDKSFPIKYEQQLTKALVYLNYKANKCLPFKIHKVNQKLYDKTFNIKTKDNEIYIIAVDKIVPKIIAEYNNSDFRRIIFFHKKQKNFNDEYLMNIFLHEMGHAYGLDHIDNPSLFMNKEISFIETVISEDEINYLCKTHCCN